MAAVVRFKNIIGNSYESGPSVHPLAGESKYCLRYFFRVRLAQSRHQVSRILTNDELHIRVQGSHCLEQFKQCEKDRSLVRPVPAPG